jgi:hypothetical protein
MNIRFTGQCAVVIAAVIFITTARAQYQQYVTLSTAPASTYVTNYSSYLNFQMPIERVGHNFSLQWRMTELFVVAQGCYCSRRR